MNPKKDLVTPLAVTFVVLLIACGITVAVYKKGTSHSSNIVSGKVYDGNSQGLDSYNFSQYPPQNIDEAFSSLKYKQLSSVPLVNTLEKTVTYVYPSSPCGTLMTQYNAIGSVRVGRGPVYALASEQCKVVNPSYIPNDFSFRTYSCENVSGSFGKVLGKATFAFQCSPDGEDTRCSQARIQGAKFENDWNCGGI